MIDSKNPHFNKYLRVLFFLKLLAFLHLILSPYTYNDLGNIIKFSENKNNIEGLLDFRIHRSLDEQEFQEQYDYTNINDNLLEDGSKNDEEYGTYYVSPYEQLSKSASNSVGVLQRNYKNRFGKKRGLAKLDHYFEKKVFDKIDDIYVFANKLNSEKKVLRKKIFMKYGIRYLLICSLPILGLILPTLFGILKYGDGIISWCVYSYRTHRHKGMDTGATCQLPYYDKGTIQLILSINNIAFFVISIIILFMFFYILLKITKYERIKAIKGKMSLKEYCKFSKGLIRKT